MPARKISFLAIMIALTLGSTHAAAQADATPLPALLADGSQTAQWPRAADGSTWVPVFMLGDGNGSLLPDPFADESTGSVLLGVAQVRGHFGGVDTATVAPALQWRLTEELGLGAALTVTEFVPCRSLMQTPLAPLKSDACQSFAGQGALGLSGSLDIGQASFSLGYSESPAIWVLPGSLGPAGVLGAPPPSLPFAPLVGVASEPAQTVSVGGELSLSEQSRVGVALAMSRLPYLENSPDIGRVQLSVGYGNFSADMATRMIRQGLETAVNPWWAGMDLGLSWRTPWSGIISVGARNLFSSGDPPRLGLSPVVENTEDDAFSRTPYVRYEQDF